MNNYIIIHGSFGSPFINWFSWLYKELESKGKSVIIPQFPTGANQNYTNWSDLLKYYMNFGYINENTVIIGHSIAPIFITKFLIENKVKVAKCIFVEGFNNVYINPEYDEVNKSMYTDNIEKIHDYCNNIICMYADNDPYLTYSSLEDFACEVADIKEIIHNGGHLNSETGYDTLEEILKYI